MPQCTAFTKTHRRCSKKSIQNTCAIHQTYYTNWLETHPPLQGFRLCLDEKEEYTYQIEQGHIKITNSYVESFDKANQSDYYEYLLHLQHIQWDTNMKMIAQLLKDYLNQPSCIEATVENIEYYFKNMFRNPTFNPGTFLIRLLYMIAMQETREGFLPNLTKPRIEKICSLFVNHPKFEGFLYTSWAEYVKQHLRNRQILLIFLRILQSRKQEWREQKKQKIHHIQKDIVDIAMHPTRVQDWYMDWETKQEVQKFFRSQ